MKIYEISQLTLIYINLKFVYIKNFKDKNLMCELYNIFIRLCNTSNFGKDYLCIVNKP